MFADHVSTLSQWYNGAAVLCERNNHGHAVLLALRAPAASRCSAVMTVRKAG